MGYAAGLINLETSHYSGLPAPSIHPTSLALPDGVAIGTKQPDPRVQRDKAVSYAYLPIESYVFQSNQFCIFTI
jgi:hypothetical protein